jgi:hypothetical protein
VRAALLAAVMLGVASAAAAQAEPAPAALPATARWSSGTAAVLPAGAIEVGIFQPLRLGVGGTWELSTHPLLDLAMPGLAVKKTWWGGGRWRVASRHSLTYPSGLLVMLQKEGTGGIVTHETHVPHIIIWNNEAVGTMRLAAEHQLTGRLGVALGHAFGRSTLDTIDLPLVWPRLAPAFDTVTGVAGVDLDGAIAGPFYYCVDLDLFGIPNRRGPVAVEHAGIVTWRFGAHWAVQAGYKLVFGTYPAPGGFRAQWHIFPLADLVYSSD